MKIIVSPSGKFYGSEQVLFDYLNSSEKEFLIFVHRKGLLYDNLKRAGRETVKSFDSVKWLYFKLIFLCVVGKAKVIYINEGGHSKYALLLARFFKKLSVIVHIRIFEDTVIKRWQNAAEYNNLLLLAISKSIQGALTAKSSLIYDPYPFNNASVMIPSRLTEAALSVGVIGRISESKGIDHILSLLGYIRQVGRASDFIFNFFGEVTEEVVSSGKYEELKKFSNVHLHGFVEDKREIFGSLNCVLHLNEKEPLGRIFLEAIDNSTPLVGINKNGIGEIASLVGLQHLLISKISEGANELLLEKLYLIKFNYAKVVRDVLNSKDKAKEIFNIAYYTETIDNLLS